MKNNYALVSILVLSTFSANAQSYCTPSFLNGCFSWSNKFITIGSINWALDASDCAEYDYTSMSTSVTAGIPVPVSVENGSWCGCAIWVDLNNNFTFEDSENLYHTYVGGSPTYVYDFDLTIPTGTPDGSYRLRVISPWGSDGVTVGDNGYGGCGDYQYGNFEDFTINVGDVSSVGENAASTSIITFPNPTNGPLTIEAGTGQPLERILVRSADGRLVQELAFTGMAAKVLVDLSALPDGVYLVQGISSVATLTVRVLKG
ncbi:MAG: T9SS type A sorting domain-containing protein [Flavobacteriales bacterium]|nr:T9SS type A sorting domain-containing protein [Flavobacteriales bacterium]